MQAEQVKELRATGMSAAAIARTLGICVQWLYRWGREHGVPFVRVKRVRVCAQCGKSIITQSKHSNKYCNWTCYRAARAAASVASLTAGTLRTDQARSRALRQSTKRCAICRRTTWAGQPMPLVLDHIDGNASNNAVVNLRLVCGNCNMQLPTFAGRNRGNGRYTRRQRYAAGQSS